MVAQLGGAFTPDLVFKCTHLLVCEGALGTPKYRWVLGRV
jgi:hypothetical protein